MTKRSVSTLSQMRRVHRALDDLEESFKDTNFWVPLHEAQILLTMCEDLVNQLKRDQRADKG